MSQPTSNQVHVNAPLTNILHAYLQKAENFVADKCFPVVPVKKQSDIYMKFPKGEWFRDTAQERAECAESAGGGFTVDTSSTYNCKVYAFHKDVSDRARQNADTPLDLDEAATRFVATKMLLRREIEFAANFFKTNTWTGSSTGGDITPATLWSAANSTPVLDVEKQVNACEEKTGYKPNVMLVSPDVHAVLKCHVDVRDFYKYTQPGIITEELLAEVFGVEKYLVCRGIKNTAAEGAADAMARIFTSKAALLVYAPPAPSIYEPSAGYCFTWSGLYGAASYSVAVSKFRLPEKKCDRIEGEMAFDMKLVASDLGVYFKDVIA